MNEGYATRRVASRGLRRFAALLWAWAVAWTPAVAAEPTIFDFIAHPNTPLACSDTPFGRHVTLGGDAEALNLVQATGIWRAEEYVPAPATATQPLDRTFMTSFAGIPELAGTTLQKAIAVDLDGDGRDEIVAAVRVSSTVVRLVVLRRGGGAGSATMIDYWEVTQNSNAVDLVAGDFDGSSDNKQEIALALRIPSGGIVVYVLTGDAQGGIAQAIGQWAGRWTTTTSTGSFSLAAGDVLLDGREQIIVVNETGNNATRALNYHLLEYQPTTTHLPVLPGNTAIGSKSFQQLMDFQFATDDGTGPGLDSITKIEADAGDLVDSAAAELVVHVQFRASSYHYIGQRLHHFTTTRDESNAIIGIAMAARSAGRLWDSSQIVQQGSPNALASFEATIANVDRVSPGEIILARSDSAPRLLVSAYKVRIDSSASFTYEMGGRIGRFRDTSTGSILSREWTFGDNTGTFPDQHPTHEYAAPGTYTVRLRVRFLGNEVRDYTRTIVVTNAGTSSGGAASTYLYNVPSSPAYEAQYTTQSESPSFVNVAVRDMDKDGIQEVMTIARDTTETLVRSVWRLSDPALPSSFGGRHMRESNNAYNGTTALELVGADFDGDSAQATIGADCRRVIEPQLRQVVWMPPYFTRLQDGTPKEATFGESVSGGSSAERRAGTFTSHDVSAYLGLSVGSEAAGVNASVKATAGYNYQTSRGALHGSENSFTIGESYSQSNGEGLVVLEQNTFDCYSYDVSTQAGGRDASSNVRMCEVIEDRRFISGSDAVTWDTEIPAAAPGHPPAQWVPLHRDWASLSLFRPVTTNAPLAAGSNASFATDGQFSTAVTSSGTSNAPYLEIDLGSVQSISNIRIVPAAGLAQAAKLKGFRVYASATPMTGSAVPSGPNVTRYQPETADDVGYDRWNIWTRGATAPYAPLSARYIRLQHPGSAALAVAQIQVFGDVHVEPMGYPEAVCDKNKADGVFQALMWNPVTSAFAAVDVRGTLLWNGSGTVTWPSPGCTNYSGLPQRDIWNAVNLGDTATLGWNLSDSQQSMQGTTTSFENSVRVGAEFDLEAGFIAKVQAGGAYEFTSGITEETQTMSFWGTGLDIGGAMGGFQQAGVFTTCRYNARPYAYKLVDRSTVGYEHTAYAVDYIVRQTSGAWQRNNVPTVCRNVVVTDRIFAHGFD